MKLKIEISLDGTAFEEGGTDEAKSAINAALEKMRGDWALVGGTYTDVRDINGNVVGKATVTP